MKNRMWYSAQLRYTIIVDGRGQSGLADSIILVEARSFTEAQAKTIKIGKAKQQDYINDEGRRVVWRLSDVLTLDVIREANLDGAEVHCHLRESLDPNVEIDAVFRPEDAAPRQTF